MSDIKKWSLVLESHENQWEREQKIERILFRVCEKLGWDDFSSIRPVIYDEEDNRSAMIFLYGDVTLEELSSLSTIADNVHVRSDPSRRDAIIVGMRIHEGLEDAKID